MSKTNSQITSIDDAPAVATPVAAAVVGNAAGVGAERVTITIHPTEGDGGGNAVPVGVNGYAYQIPRGSPQSVPREVLEVLQNARSTLMTNAPGGAIIERVIPRFAFSVQ